MSRATLHLEVIERHRYEVSDPEVAAQIRQALKADDIERLSELIDFLNITGPQETSVLTCQVLRQEREVAKQSQTTRGGTDSRPTWAELTAELASQPEQTFTASGVVGKDGPTLERHHVTEQMTPHQRGVYGLYWHAFWVRATMAKVFRDSGHTDEARQCEAMALPPLMRKAYEKASDEEWAALCAPHDYNAESASDVPTETNPPKPGKRRRKGGA